MFETLFAIAFWLGCTYYVYKDAELRPNNRTLWTVLTFIFPLIGIIGWFIFRKPKVTKG